MFDPLCGPDDDAPQFVSVSSATFAAGDGIAPDSIVSGYGPGLAAGAFQATVLPLPTELGGVQVEVIDSEGVTRLALMFFVNEIQVNYLMPPETAFGPAIITVRTSTGRTITGTVEIIPLAPGLYTATSSGTGLAAAFILRVAEDGTRTEELVYNPDLTPAPIDLGPPGEQVFLILFGTGFRAGAEAQLRAVVGGELVPVLGVAAHADFAGLDQGSIGPFPRSLAGRGPVAVALRVGGERSNIVGVVMQ